MSGTSHAANTQRGAIGLRDILSTIDRRFVGVSFLGTIVAFVVLGIPTAVIPNPYFVRMTPVDAVALVVWVTSAPLVGLLVATYFRPRDHPARESIAHVGGGRITVGGIAAFLAIGCPVCNKLVVGLIGVSGALNIFAPLQPVLGGFSVALLAATLVWRLRERARGCDACAVSPRESNLI